jgi:DNA-binding NtrC family response regulator
VTIHIAPLRERGEDIHPLAQYFLEQQLLRYRKKIKGFDDSTVTALTTYDWPGNVRELSHVVERAVLMCQGDTVQVDDLGLRPAAAPAVQLENMSLEEVEKFLIKRLSHGSTATLLTPRRRWG